VINLQSQDRTRNKPDKRKLKRNKRKINKEWFLKWSDLCYVHLLLCYTGRSRTGLLIWSSGTYLSGAGDLGAPGESLHQQQPIADEFHPIICGHLKAKRRQNKLQRRRMKEKE